MDHRRSSPARWFPRPVPGGGSVGYYVPFGWSGLSRCLGAQRPGGPAYPTGVPISPEKWGERGPGASAIGRRSRLDRRRLAPATWIPRPVPGGGSRLSLEKARTQRVAGEGPRPPIFMARLLPLARFGGRATLFRSWGYYGAHVRALIWGAFSGRAAQPRGFPLRPAGHASQSFPARRRGKKMKSCFDRLRRPKHTSHPESASFAGAVRGASPNFGSPAQRVPKFQPPPARPAGGRAVTGVGCRAAGQSRNIEKTSL